MNWFITKGSLLLLVCCMFAVAAGCTGETASTEQQSTDESVAAARPDTWAQPLTGAGLKNFYQVSPQLYRGAQPTAEGFQTLADRGVKKVINLRHYHDDAALLAGTGLAYVWIKMDAHDPQEDAYLRFLQEVTRPEDWPVYVHCQHGSDRTGTAVALFRIHCQGWDREAAIREMTEGGFGYHAIFRRLPIFVREYQPMVDGKEMVFTVIEGA